MLLARPVVHAAIIFSPTAWNSGWLTRYSDNSAIAMLIPAPTLWSSWLQRASVRLQALMEELAVGQKT
jgi:hypothetical protein